MDHIFIKLFTLTNFDSSENLEFEIITYQHKKKKTLMKKWMAEFVHHKLSLEMSLVRK